MITSKADAKKFKTQIANTQASVRDLSIKHIHDNIKSLWQEICQQDLDKAMGDLPVELVAIYADSPESIVSLPEQNIVTVKDLMEHTLAAPVAAGSTQFKQLTQLQEDARKFKALYGRHSVPELVADSPSVSVEKLLGFLFNEEKIAEQIRLMQERYLPDLAALNQALDIIIEKDTNALLRIFQSSGKKHEVEQAKDYANQRLGLIAEIEQKMIAVYQIPTDKAEVAADFQNNREDYYHRLKAISECEPDDADMWPLLVSTRIKETDQVLGSTTNTEIIDEKITEQWQTLKRDRVKEELAGLPISILDDDGELAEVVNLLPLYGINTIGDILKLEKNQFAAQFADKMTSADRAYAQAEAVGQEVLDKMFPRLNPDKLFKNDLKLLEMIWQKNQHQKQGQLIQKQADQLLPAIKEALAIVTQKDVDAYQRVFQETMLKEMVQQAKNYIMENIGQLYKLIADIDALDKMTISNQALTKDFSENSAKYYAAIEAVTGSVETYAPSDLPNYIVDKVNEYDIQLEGLTGDLRPYQLFGAKYALYNKKNLLGDEMGLGKTIQAIAMINHLDNNGQHHAMVVCPLSVIANWKREVEKWSDLAVFIFHGKGREEALDNWQNNGGVMLTTYEHSKKLTNEDVTDLNCIVVDEAHYVKNPSAQRSLAVYRLTKLADYALYMTGTPLENRLDEMKQLISVLKPEMAQQFAQNTGLNDPDTFKKFVSTVYLRRKRDDVLLELPDLDEIQLWSDFSDVEQQFYDEAVESGLGGLMKMRQAGFHGKTPNKSGKLRQLIDICDEARGNGHKVQVFSYFKSVLKLVASHLSERTFEVISGEITTTRRQEIIDEFTDAAPGSVLISQIEAGGVGLNIQAANIVILCEPQWKPSIEQQAISRVYRMGQTRNVIVYRLLTEESIDESLMKILGDKTEIFNVYARDSDVADAFDQRDIAKDEPKEENLKKKVFVIEQERLAERREKIS